MRQRKVKQSYGSWEEGLRDIATILNSEPTFSVTLDVSATSTTVANVMVGISSVISFMPETANAAADMNSMYVSSRGKQTFTITHANNGNTDRTFAYDVRG